MKHKIMFKDICEEFRRTGNKKKLKEYYDEYIFSCDTFDDFLKQDTLQEF